MRDLIKAEWLKVWSGRAWWGLATAAAGLCVLADSGFIVQTEKQPAGQTTAAGLTATLVQGWFMVELAAALVAMLAVTKEFGSGAILRSALVSRGRARLLTAKLVAAAASGALFALVTGALAAAGPWLLLAGHREHPQWSPNATWTLLGVMLVVVVGAVWGSLLGLLIRNQVAAVVTLLLSTWLVSGGLLRLAPSVGKFTMDEAMAAVYRDGHTDLLPIPVAILVMAGWLALAGVFAGRRFLTRDLP